MESLPMVCYSRGTMNSLVNKLEKMKLSNETEEFSNLTQEFKKVVLSLKEDFFGKPAMPKVCMKQVRELVFKIEDWIDQKPETNMLDPSDTEGIRSFMTKIDEARERFTWYYDLLKIVPTEPDVAGMATSNIDISPRLLLEETPCHGLLDGPRDKLIEHLTDDKDEMRKVVSVVGMEGLGKTTLAKEIYSVLQLSRQFQCQAFVSVGSTNVMKKILYMILRQLNPLSEKLKPEILMDVKEIITELGEYLRTKRYFILVDGIQSTWAWNVINCVLPNNRGSRVLTTTCIMDIGMYCSSYPNDLVYQMKALNEENSRILFHSKAITLHEEEKWAGFEEDFRYVLEMCCGMPLAIIVTAGLLLARKSETLAELKMGRESICPLQQYSTSEWMTKILHMSFADISLPLRSCFLYLSVFPENYVIRKDRLIRLWGAEGFIPRKWLWVTGEMFFNELISRRLIQPVFNFNDDQAVGCTIHGVILDFIRSLSREENFAMSATGLNSGPFPCDTIRRFSLDCGNEDEADTLSTSSVHLSSIRSLTVFGDVEGKLYPPDFPGDDERISSHPQRLPLVSKHGEEMPATQALGVSMSFNLSTFKLLRVLDLEDTQNLKNHHLEGIGGLVLLRYLGLGGTGITQLPQDIGKLERLQTLDLMRNIGLTTFPASIVNLQELRHLLLQGYHAKELWEMRKLEVVSGIDVESSSSLGTVVELLRKSERLRMLSLTLTPTSKPRETDLVPFLDEVVKSNLQWLSLNWHSHDYEHITLLVDSWEKATAPLAKNFEPRKFELRIRGNYLKRVPPNMGSLASLTHFHIELSEAKAEDFHVLGGLTNLVLLNLIAKYCYVRERLTIKKGIFPCLKVFSFKVQYSWTGLKFEAGAMPQLQRLGRSFPVSERGNRQYPDNGMEHLTCLTRVHATINCSGATVSEVEAAEAAIRGQLSKMATKPTLELSREDEQKMREDEQGHHSVVSPFRWQASEETSGGRSLINDSGARSCSGDHMEKKVSEETSIQQLEDNDQIQEDEVLQGQQSIHVSSRSPVSKKTDKSTLELSIENVQDKGKHYIPSKRKVFLFEQTKNIGRKWVATRAPRKSIERSTKSVPPLHYYSSKRVAVWHPK